MDLEDTKEFREVEEPKQDDSPAEEALVNKVNEITPKRNVPVCYYSFSKRENTWFLQFDEKIKREKGYGTFAEIWKTGSCSYKVYRHSVDSTTGYKELENEKMYLVLYNIVRGQRVVADVVHHGAKNEHKVFIRARKTNEENPVTLELLEPGYGNVCGAWCKFMGIAQLKDRIGVDEDWHARFLQYYKVVDENLMKAIQNQVMQDIADEKMQKKFIDQIMNSKNNKSEPDDSKQPMEM
jgi:hypothetical protein